MSRESGYKVSDQWKRSGMVKNADELEDRKKCG
jgi:hypothetical protein